MKTGKNAAWDKDFSQAGRVPICYGDCVHPQSRFTMGETTFTFEVAEELKSAFSEAAKARHVTDAM